LVIGTSLGLVIASFLVSYLDPAFKLPIFAVAIILAYRIDFESDFKRAMELSMKTNAGPPWIMLPRESLPPPKRDFVRKWVDRKLSQFGDWLLPMGFVGC
jgi:hypothetical protein